MDLDALLASSSVSFFFEADVNVLELNLNCTDQSYGKTFWQRQKLPDSMPWVFILTGVSPPPNLCPGIYIHNFDRISQPLPWCSRLQVRCPQFYQALRDCTQTWSLYYLPSRPLRQRRNYRWCFPWLGNHWWIWSPKKQRSTIYRCLEALFRRNFKNHCAIPGNQGRWQRIALSIGEWVWRAMVWWSSTQKTESSSDWAYAAAREISKR